MAFGIDPALNWRTLASSVGGTFEPGDFWSPDRVTLVSPPWTLTLTHTAVAAPLTVATGELLACGHLRLRLLRGEFLRSSHGLDLAPLTIGGPAFFGTSRLTASDSALARELFSCGRLRSRLVAEPHLALDVSYGKLRLALSGHVHEKDRLVALLALGIELLQRLKDLGAIA